jgi:hypothetical protein
MSSYWEVPPQDLSRKKKAISNPILFLQHFCSTLHYSKMSRLLKDKTHMKWSGLPMGFTEEEPATKEAIGTECQLVSSNLFYPTGQV